MFSYNQERTGYLFVLANGINTTPMNIILCPERKDPENLKLINIFIDLQVDERKQKMN